MNHLNENINVTVPFVLVGGLYLRKKPRGMDGLLQIARDDTIKSDGEKVG